MAFILRAENEFDGLAKLLELITSEGHREGAFIELECCHLVIAFQATAWAKYEEFTERIANVAGQAGIKSRHRVKRVYTEQLGKITKPSYIGRLKGQSDVRDPIDKSDQTDQIEIISQKLAAKPGYSCLSFVVARPWDVRRMIRPGTVTCLTAGDVKFREDKLRFSAFFRTCDALLVGHGDILYLRKIQMDILKRSKELTVSERLINGKVGDLDLFFSRAYIPRRVEVKVGEKVDGIVVAEEMIKLIRKEEATCFKEENI